MLLITYDLTANMQGTQRLSVVNFLFDNASISLHLLRLCKTRMIFL